MAAVELITVLVLLQFLYFAILAGRARQRYGVMAPAVTGNEIFERYLRVQMNTRSGSPPYSCRRGGARCWVPST